jgi:hypothetical protein
MVVRDIHNQFIKARENNQYTFSQFDKFIKETKVYRDTILGLDPTDTDWRTIWEPSIMGPDLITISYS